ncbi:hypothetical protein QBC46DRAFT_262989 [Diplogelasinospora grovesii]|uniref:Uncharacterized protein n=1 Tax=Diplogelasinospora grovesii TaxID=303347 RepID=A0AAN6N5J1_9PEZI|nr:hypothetical protein QBC46DRAFT_262989 [Diplogelasinospora grovesii]
MAAATPPGYQDVVQIEKKKAAADAHSSGSSSSCVHGAPASSVTPDAGTGWPIDSYTYIRPTNNNTANWTFYGVEQTFYSQHLISGPHYMGLTHATDPYGAFKCQYTCNADAKCVSYFVSYEKVGTNEEHMNCILFDAIIGPENFVKLGDNSTTIGAGGYDRLCVA